MFLVLCCVYILKREKSESSIVYLRVFLENLNILN